MFFSAEKTSKYLSKANITLLATKECASLSKNNSNLLPRGIDPLSMICAGEIDGSKDTCKVRNTTVNHTHLNAEYCYFRQLSASLKFILPITLQTQI